jgi:serine protease Do
VSRPVGVEDGFDDDGAEYRPPPALDDRLWRHPAEMGRVATPPSTVRVRRSPWALGFVSVVGSAVLAGSLMFTAGGIGDEPQRLDLHPLATLVAVSAGDSSAGIVAIDVDSGTGVRHGNGMVLDDGVHIVTSLQLVPANATSSADNLTVRVVDNNGVTHQGAVVGRDAMNDLAIIRTDGGALQPWVGAAPAGVAAGDLITAYGGGSGAGLRSWRGTVRNVDAAMRNDTVELVGVALLTDLLPPAAAGAIVHDAKGNFLGLLSVDLPTKATSSMATAAAAIVPASRVLAVTRQFLSGGKISHGWLGVEAPAPAETTLSVSLHAGATVDEVVPESPAGTAGVQHGDVLLSVCGHPVDSIDEVLTQVLATAPGTVCPLVISRGGERWQTTAIIGERAA